ncbi:photosynthetic complex putative assembly protein PuhB [Methylobacterium nigriterrae]|uniref:photosynthetic complex putative assembly protein PuhB n=1 Tax=Methylobacterium nigriterrae TaxID=3127512 RepID=UPI003014027D
MSAPEIPRGLPGPLPPGERILWQGRPTARGIAARALHARLVGLWFAGLALWSGVPAAQEGGLAHGLQVAGPTLAVGAGAVLLIAGLGWLSARTTTYTITNRRIVLQIGIALQATLNLPFAMIADAGLHGFRDGSGDIPVRLRAGTRIAYPHLWPHARPWRVSEPQPMLRSVPDAAQVAHILAAAVEAARAPEETALPILVERPPVPAHPPRLAVARAG